MGADGSPPRWLKHVNKPLTVLLRLDVPISRHESPVVLAVPGRRTGRARLTPVTPCTSAAGALRCSASR